MHFSLEMSKYGLDVFAFLSQKEQITRFERFLYLLLNMLTRKEQIMFSNFVIVGKIKEVPVVNKTENGTSYAHVLLECDRTIANDDGTYKTDEFDVTLWRGAAEECAQVCRVGSIIAVKGRLESHTYSKEDRSYRFTSMVAEKLRMITI